MFFAIITLLTALALAGVAATFAIFGIVAIFSGLPAYALAMGVVIELGKIVGVSWVYRHWEEKTLLKYLMIPFIIMAMALTSLGIFGLLSRAYIEQSAGLETNTVLIERLDQRIAREQRTIADAELVIDQLDQTVSTLIEFNRISGPDGARAVRAGQQEQRDELQAVIQEANDRLDTMLDERAEATIAIQSLEREVGPVMYIAQMIYSDEIDIDQAVRWVIIAFIFVFDPMAIMLLMAANYSLMQRGVYLERGPPPKPEPTPVPDDPELEQEPEEVVEEPEPSPEPRPAPADDSTEFVDIEPVPQESPENFVSRLMERHEDPDEWYHSEHGELVSDQGVIARGISQEDARELIGLAKWLREQSRYEDVNLGQLGKDRGIILRRLKKENE